MTTRRAVLDDKVRHAPAQPGYKGQGGLYLTAQAFANRLGPVATRPQSLIVVDLQG